MKNLVTPHEPVPTRYGNELSDDEADLLLKLGLVRPCLACSYATGFRVLHVLCDQDVLARALALTRDEIPESHDRDGAVTTSTPR